MLSDLIFNFKFFLNKNFKLRIIFLFINHIINIFLDIVSVASIPALLVFFLNKNDIQVEVDFINNIVNYVMDFVQSKSTFLLVLLIFIFFTIKTVLKITYFAYFTKFGLDLSVNISGKVLKKKLNNTYLNYLQSNYSNFLNLMTTITDDFVQNNFLITYNIIISFVTLLFYFIFLLAINPITTVSIILLSLISFMTYYFLTKKKFISFGKHKLILVESTLSKIKDIFNSYKEIKIYGVKNFFYERFINVKKAWATNKLKFAIISNLPKLLLELGLLIIIFIILAVSFKLELKISYIAVNIAAFSIAALRIFPVVIVLLRNVSKINYSKKAQVILINELNKKICNNDQKKNINFKKMISLEKVSFGYNEEKTILKNIDFTINKGSFIGIRGESGQGKSTLVNIIMGILNPTRGKVLIDGMDISISTNSYLKLISYIPQKVTIIDDTIKNNLLFGNQLIKINDQEIINVLNKVKLENIINNHKKKLDTIIGETTIRASEGEIQRLGIARALLQNRELLILDEITSSLDEKNEKNIMNIIKNLSKDSTIIMISHKNTTLEYCDEIYSLSDKQLIKKKLI